jgi:hypothetical protein
LRLPLHPSRFWICPESGAILLRSPLDLSRPQLLLRALFTQVQRMDRYLDAFVAAAIHGARVNEALDASSSPSPPETATTAAVVGPATTEAAAVDLPADKGAPLRDHPRLYEKWKAGWSERSDRDAFLAGLRDDMERMRARYEEIGLWERVVDYAQGLRELQAKAQEDIWAGQRPKCAECRGFCCARVFGEGHLRDPYDLALFAVARPEIEQFVHSMDHNGCYFLGPEGCLLPRDVRPRVCIMYACDLMPKGSESTPGIQALARYYQQHRWLLPWRGVTSYQAVLTTARRVLPNLEAVHPYRGQARFEGTSLMLGTEVVYHPEVESVLLRVSHPLRIPGERLAQVHAAVERANSGLADISFAVTPDGHLMVRDLVVYGVDTLEAAGLESRLTELLARGDVELGRLWRESS